MEVYIEIDPATRMVTLKHSSPLDPVQGLGQSKEELLKKGYFISECDIPEPATVIGKRAILYFDPEKQKAYYNYIIAPMTTDKRLSLIEGVLNELLLEKGVLADE